jgi:hypothetical protein
MGQTDPADRRALSSFHGFSVVPWHPLRGITLHLLDMLLQCRQVVERIGIRQLCGVDQAHEHVADVGPSGGLVEVTVFPAQYCFL